MVVKDFRDIKDNEPLPKFPMTRPVPTKIEVAVRIDKWAPTLQSYFMNMSDVERETMVLRHYSVKKLKETGCSPEEIREVWGD